VLNADGIEKPEAAALDGAGESQARVPIAKVRTFLNVDAGKRIGGAEAPAIVAVRGFKTEDGCAGVSVGRTEATGLNFGGARSVDIETRREDAVDRISDFESVEKILGFARTGAGDMKIVQMVADDFGQGDEAFHKNVGVGHGDVANVAGGERGALRGVLSVDLVRRRSDLDFFVKLLFVVQSESELIWTGMEGKRLAGEQKKAGLANFHFVVPNEKISQDESA